MSSEDREAQEDELLALASIYDEDEFKKAESVQGGETRICLDLPQNFKIFVSGNPTECLQNGGFEYTICFLPPLVLNFELPPDYPSTSPPAFTLSGKWLSPTQVKELVEEELFARYDRLLLQSTLDLMADVVYCPRPCCQTPVMQEPGCTMGICSSCNYAFCTLCKMTYHGVSPCKVTAEKLIDLRNEYLGADEANKRFLEQRYGKRVIQKALEEMESKEWLEKNSKSCPCCGTHIEKLDGCNKMTCTGCMQYFCWICMGCLSRANPYRHFNDPSSPCFNRLFQAVDVDGDIWEDEIED
uniref:RBR-type E3 ubiquitin transferase n=1 Tax=Monodelphis domestica TaxID=13616 RepID=A0A5F8HCH9_MONDO